MKEARSQAANLIGKILRHQGSLATLLPAASEQVPVQDRPLLQEFCYGVCRWQPRLDAYVQRLLAKPLRAKDLDVHALLLLGLYQLEFMRVPDHAALNATVNAAAALKKPWAKNLVNGVLREFLREREPLQQALRDDRCFQSAHPLWLLQRWDQAWPTQVNNIVEANNLPPPFTLRVNAQKISRTEYLQQLSSTAIEATPTPYSPVGVTLNKALRVEDLLGFLEGLVSVQDEAPQLAAELLDCHPGQRVLDACSAPGGKTAHLLERYRELNLVAVDISEQRLQRTRDNLQRLSLHAHVCVGDACYPATWWDGVGFDRILLDAPCSATGIIRRQPDIKILRDSASVAKLVASQMQMLVALWPLLNVGGILLYATCSTLPEENSELVAAFLAHQLNAEHIAIEATWGEAQTVGRQLLPQAGGHDGFYYALLRKTQP